MFVEVADALNTLAKDEACTVAAITGKGKFYSSGNDISNFLKIYS